MIHPTLDELLTPIRELYKDVKRKALMRLEYEGLHTADVIVTPGARFYNDPAAYAMDRYAYYVCYKCNKVLQYCLYKIWFNFVNFRLIMVVRHAVTLK